MDIKSWLDKFIKFFWAFLLISLPITSFPYFPGLLGDTVQVRPLALYPLGALTILVTLPRLFTTKISKTIIPFIIFVLIAVLSSVFSLTQNIIPSINVTVGSRVLRTLLTLALGGMFYLIVSLYPRDSSDLKFTLKWLYIGFGIALVWASFQILYVIKYNETYFRFLNDIQSLISSRRLFDKRISGMTYEPSWFAEQLTLTLVPMLFGSIMSGYSTFRWRYHKLTIEWILLLGSVIALLFTFSRSGLANFIVLLVLSLIVILGGRNLKKEVRWRHWVKVILQIGFVLVLLSAIVFAVAQRNNYFSRIWNYWSDEESEGTYFYYIAFGQRFTYWETAYRMFQDHPGLGVGLGNYAFYFKEYLPDRQYKNPELVMKLVPEAGRNQIVTVKNFTLRILTETGILGAGAFLAFLIALVGCVIFLLMSKGKESQFWGLAGLLGMVSFLMVTFSIDSFAIPNMWVVFGLITASTSVFTQGNEINN